MIKSHKKLIIAASCLALIFASCTTTNTNTPGQGPDIPETEEPSKGTEQGTETDPGKNDTSSAAPDDRTSQTPEDTAVIPSTGDVTQIIEDEVSETMSLTKATKTTGFNITVPESLTIAESEYTQMEINLIHGQIIEVVFVHKNDGEKENSECRLRKGFGNLDVSNNFTLYRENRTVTNAGIRYYERGNNSKFNVISWVSGDYSYSISSTVGLTEDDIKKIIQLFY